MSTDLYELIAYAARYWFALLAVLVAFYGWRACVTDNRRARILRYQAHGAGCVGELVMLDDGTKKKKNRKKYPQPIPQRREYPEMIIAHSMAVISFSIL